MSLKNCVAFKQLLGENLQVNLLLLNVDNFSNINDSFGVEHGDFVLEFIYENLHRFNFHGVDIYSLESDEFALVSEGVFDEDKCIEMANEIASFFNETDIVLDDELSINISFSIGITNAKGLNALNQARLVIKELRLHTRGTYKVYDMLSPYIKAVHDNIFWLNRIQKNISEDNFVTFFQPIVNNKTNQIEKYECLSRMEEDGEFISPFHFMEAAKQTRLVSFITKSVIKQACKKFKDTDYEFSINITNDDLQLNYLENYLLKHATINGIEPSRIVLELLEDISSLDEGTILEQIASLQESGFQLAIDDFGSESSNFTRLLEFTPDYIKIDGAFIKDIIMENKSQIITQGIVKIAHGMNIKVIAEYVHDEDVQEELTYLGVDYSQGYYHGAPSRELKEI